MANLLQKASIVLTPTAYDDGKVLCAKPSEPPYGDFDFSRNSAATRVNAQGLVENVQILSSNLVQNGDFSEEGVQEVSNGSFSQEGSELITNGDFSNGSTDWNLIGTATITENQANIVTASAVTGISQSNILTVGKSYKLSYNIVSNNNGGLKISGNEIPSVVGNNTYYFEASAASLEILRNSGVTDISITNLSVREVGQDWTLGTGWSIGENKAVAVSGASTKLTQSISGLSGKICKVSLTLSDYGGNGSVRVDFGSVSSDPINTNGEHTIYGTYDNNAFELFKNNGFTGSITNISVKEVGMDWTLNDWSVGNSLISSGNTSSLLQQSFIYTSTTSIYKTTFRARSVSGASVTLRLYDGGGSNWETFTITSSNFQDFELTRQREGTDSGLSFYNNSNAEIEITNISVIEITDDTNLPRINYEGFSYQDALGSENIDLTTGNTLDASAWGSVATSGVSYLAGAGAISYYNTGFVVTSGLTYKLSFTLSGYTGSGDLGFSTAGGVSTSARLSANGVYTEYFIASSSTQLRFFGRSTNTAVFSNVSVKEYLGQEVVPNSGCGSWLFEPQSTNLITYSEDFSQWIASGCTVGNSSSVVSPSNSNNIGIITGTIGTGAKFARINVITSSSIITYSAFFKYNSHQWVQFASGGTSEYANFDIQNGVVGNKLSGTTSTIDNFGNGWYRCTLSTSVASTPSNMAVVLIDTANSSRLEATSSVGSAYIWGAMLEQNSFSTSYIPTSGSTVTRNQDVCTNGGSLATINSTEGTLYFEFKPNSTDISVVSISDGSTSNFIQIYIPQTASSLRYRATTSGVAQFNNQISTAIDLTLNHKYAIKWKLNDFSLWVDGVKINSQLIGSTPIGLNQINFYNVFGGGNKANGKTKALAVWKEALSDQELAELTYPTPTAPTFSLDFDTIAEQFTFARGSEATYVDAQGLIQSTNELGPELITNGDFSNGSTDWVLNDWTVANGKASLLNGSSFINQNNILEVGKTYKIQYTISDYVSGNIRWRNAGVNGSINTSNGVVTDYITVASTGFGIQGYNGFTGSIDNISAKEYTTATNTPRLDYSTGAEAFLLEPQSTNLIPYSEDYNSGNWFEYNETSATIDASQSNPSGANGSYKIESLSGLGRFGLSAITVAPSTNYTLSFYVKNIDATLLKVILGSGASPGSYTYTSEVNTSDWSRVSVNFTTGAVTSMQIQFLRDLPIGESAYIWGAQLEQLSYATSYIPSNGSQTTRNQETCINATPEINSEEGVLYAEISALADDLTLRSISLSDGSTNNVVTIRYRTNSNRIQIVVFSGGVLQFSNSFDVTNILDFNKVAISYNQSNFNYWVNGVKRANSTSGNTPIGLNELSFDDGNSGLKYFGNTKDLQVYTKALSDAELIKLTT